MSAASSFPPFAKGGAGGISGRVFPCDGREILPVPPLSKEGTREIRAVAAQLELSI